MSTAAQEVIEERSEGPEWGSPVELSEFAPVLEAIEPPDEPGPSDCAR